MKIPFFIARRMASSIFVFIGLILITFLLTYVIPADPARYFAGPDATEEQVNALKHQFGLDRPPHEQFLSYVNRLLHGDLGRSLHTRNLVMEDLTVRFPATLELALVSIVISTFVGVLFGVISAVKKDTIIDNVVRVFSLGGVAVPGFLLALLFQYVLYSQLGLFPVGGRVDLSIELRSITGLNLIDSIITMNWPAFVSSLHHIILPSLCLSYITLSSITRLTRSSMLETLSQDYIKTARAKGLSNFTVTYKHALRNALIPPLTVVGLKFGNILGGTVLIELIFMWPGVGTYMANSLLTLDFPAIMGATLWTAFVYVIVNFLVDMVYLIVDPRIGAEHG